MRPPLRAAAALVAAASCAGCITRPVREDVFEQGGIEVFLRSDVRITRPLEKGYQHPVTISPVRMAHILSRIDMRTEAGRGKSDERVAAIPTEMLFGIAEGVSTALARANQDQEVVVMAIERTRRFHVFDRNYLTSFVAYVRDDRLYLHLVRSGWEIPPRREDHVPEPRAGDHPMEFRLYSGTAMTLVDAQSVAVEWRDPVFARPTRTAILPSGEVVRKTILMESPPEEWIDEEAAPDVLPGDLSPDQLRALADLEERRRQGRVTESEYLAERRKILNPL